MDIEKDIQFFLDNPDQPVTKEWMEQAKAEYPYYIVPEMLYLRYEAENGGKVDEDVLGDVALSIPERTALYGVVGENADRFANFYPKEPEKSAPDTETTVDTFLREFGHSDERELAVLNQMIFNPTPDYGQVLAAEEEKSRPTGDELKEDSESGLSRNDVLINQFINQAKEINGHFPTQKTEDEPPKTEERPQEPETVDTPVSTDDSMLSESLAKIYIKQRKYSKALQIIKSISLKFPEKSIYFADQIRFLQKLIITEQIKNKK